MVRNMRTLKVLQTKNRKKSISNIILTVLTIICISASASFALSRNNTLENDYLTQIDGSLMTDNPSTEEIVAMTEYDGRNYGLVTPVKSQGDTNLCWAYSSVSASETSILKSGINGNVTSETLNLNPIAAAYRMQRRQSDPLNNTDGELILGDYTAATGTPSKIATLFSGWWGPVSGNDATVDPFENSEYRFENAIHISEHKDDYEQRVTAIKSAIAEYGAVTFQYNNAHNYEYYNPKNEKDSNSYPHACTLIGWNDDIPAMNFQPGGATRNGGWLVKNSYSGLPDGYPYFYLSYDNTSSVCYAFTYANRDAYDRNYYYDGGSDDFSLRNDKIVANVYRAAGSDDPCKGEQIKAVNIGINGEDYTLEVEIYRHLDSPFGNSDAPVSGGVSAAIMRRSFKYGGFVTVKFDNPITIEKDEWFSVIVRITSGNAVIRLGYKNGRDLSYAGTSTGYSKLGNFVGRIKAYTSLCDSEPGEDWNFTNLVVFAKFNGESEFIDDVYENTKVRDIIDNTYSNSYYSVKDYFANISGGKVKMKTLYLFDGNGSVTLSKKRGYYFQKSDENPDGYDGNGADRTVDLRYDWSESLNRALNAGNLPRSADGNSVYRISDLDKNGDGKIDCITVIYKNSPSTVNTSWAAPLLNYQDYTSGVEITENGKTYIGNVYVQLTLSYENDSGSVLYKAEDDLPIVAPSVICHETLHVFGLKDLYRSDLSSEIGFMSVMGKGISPIAQSISVKEAEDLGFVNEKQIKTLTSSGTYNLQPFAPSSDGVVAYKFDLPDGEKTLYLEYRDFDSRRNKYDDKNKRIHYCGNGSLSVEQKYPKSGLVCYMVKTGMKFPSNLHTVGEDWNYYVVSGGIQSTKIDCALGINDYIDLTENLSVEVKNISDGVLTFSVCGDAFNPLPEHRHNLVKYEEVKATCTVDGRKAHYECTGCNKLFEDEDAEKELNESDLVIPAGHRLIEISAVGATCLKNGKKAYFKCENCNKSFIDSSATQEIQDQDLIIPAGHVFGEWQDEIPATETADGIKGHKDCLVCGKHFDGDGNEIADLKIPKKETDKKPDDNETPDDENANASTQNGCGGRTAGMLPIALMLLVVTKRRIRN